MVNDPETIGSQTGKDERPDPWKRQETRGKKKKGKNKKKMASFSTSLSANMHAVWNHQCMDMC